MNNNPNILYKYYPPKSEYIGGSAISVLENLKVTWTAPQAFNDPYDTQLEIKNDFEWGEIRDEIINEFVDCLLGNNNVNYLPDDLLGICNLLKPTYQKASKVLGMTKLEIKENFAKKIDPSLIENTKRNFEEAYAKWYEYTSKMRIFCTSSHPDSLLMWSHYGRSHTGVAIGFKKSNNSFLKLSHPVNYDKNIPTIFTKNIMLKWMFKHESPNFSEQVKSLLYTKCKEWAYENEWRCQKNNISDDKLHTLMDIEIDDISCIYFGCKIKDEHKEEILNLIKKLNSKIEMFDFLQHKKQFKLIPVKINA